MPDARLTDLPNRSSNRVPRLRPTIHVVGPPASGDPLLVPPNFAAVAKYQYRRFT
jgi:hypothetical protein